MATAIPPEDPYLCLWRALHDALLLLEEARGGEAEDGCNDASDLFRRFKALTADAAASYLANCPSTSDAELPSLEICGYSWHDVMLRVVRLVAGTAMWSIRGCGNNSLRLAKQYGPPHDIAGTIVLFESARSPHWPAIVAAVGQITLSDFERERLRVRVEQEAERMRPQDPWSYEASPKRWAEVFGISERTFRRRRKEGRIRCLEVTERRIRVHRDDLPKGGNRA